MTATTYDGRKVVDDQPAQSPITATNGTPVAFKQIRQLTLDDGEIVFGCAHCDYVSPNRNSIRPHLIAHNGPRARRLRAAADAEPATITPVPDPDPAPPAPATALPDPSDDGAYPVLEHLLQRLNGIQGQWGAERDKLTGELHKTTVDRDRWKARALRAERFLEQLDKALTVDPVTAKGA